MYITRIVVDRVDLFYTIFSENKPVAKSCVVLEFSDGSVRQITSYKQLVMLCDSCFGIAHYKYGDSSCCAVAVYDEFRYKTALGVGIPEITDASGFCGDVFYNYRSCIYCFDNGIVVLGSDVFTYPCFMEDFCDKYVQSRAKLGYESLKLYMEGGYFYYAMKECAYRVKLSDEFMVYLAKISVMR